MRSLLYKGAVVSSFFICMCLYNFSISHAATTNEGGSKHISTGRILEFSLRNLKESLQKTKQKNDQLIFENAAFRKDIQYFKRMVKSLSLKKVEVLGQPLTGQEESQMILAGILDGKERVRRTDELTAIFEEDILDLKEKIQFLDHQLDQNNFNSQNQLLLDRKKEIQNNIAQAEKRLKVLDKKSRGPKKTIRELNSTKNALGQKLAVLQEKVVGY